MTRRNVLVVAAMLALGAAPALADDPPQAQFQAERDIYVGVPFTLSLVVQGFDESPEPAQPTLAITGANVTALGVRPKISQRFESINGRERLWKDVRWVMQWSVVPTKEGDLKVPTTAVEQGSKKATASAGNVEARSVPTTDAMKLSLGLPDRPVYVGENIKLVVHWLFRADPQGKPEITLPLGDDDFTVATPPPQQGDHTLSLTIGTKTLDVPYKVDRTTLDGVAYNQLQLELYAAPRRVGKIEVAPATVVASLPAGQQDAFGEFGTALFRTADVAHTLEAKPLPETDKPASFAGAVGQQFSIAVTTSRSVVSLGEPVELAITVKSDQRLDTLALPRLDGPDELPKDKFAVPQDAPTGELSDDAKTKTFKVTAQLTATTGEIPALAFSYFDPQKATYQTIHSDPIALSVKGGTVIGADQVVSAAPSKKTVSAETVVSLGNADLALSEPGRTGDRPIAGGTLWLLVGLLYALPLALFAGQSWRRRTAGRREDIAEIKAAQRRADDELARAEQAPARDAAGPLAAALRNFARVAGQPLDDGGLLAKLETESFAPAAGSQPISNALRSDALALIRKWASAARRKPPAKSALPSIEPRRPSATLPPGGKPPSSMTVLGIVVALAGSARVAGATPAANHSLEDARDAYQLAMTKTAASERRTAFARAASLLGQVAADQPDSPELLADWGNAALGAGDLATATLAYRRALAIDPGNARAQQNLAWLREQVPGVFHRAHVSSAADTLFFFHRWPSSRRWLVGAVAFAIAVLLVVPWSVKRRRGLRGLAVLPLAVWIAMLVSIVVEDHHADDAVVMDGVALRVADNDGAPSALTEPLPRGAEVTVVESRESWTRIRIASGALGWVPASAVERVSLAK